MVGWLVTKPRSNALTTAHGYAEDEGTQIQVNTYSTLLIIIIIIIIIKTSRAPHLVWARSASQ